MTAIKLYLLMAKLVMLSFGGAYSIWALLDSAIVVSCPPAAGAAQNTQVLQVCRHEFSAVFALGEVLPGPQVNAISMLAFQQFGIAGMLAVLLGLLSPGLVLVPLVQNLQKRATGSSFMLGFYRGAALATLAILCLFLFQLSRSGVIRHEHWSVAALLGIACAFWLSFRFRVNPLFVVTGGAIAGYFLLQ